MTERLSLWIRLIASVFPGTVLLTEHGVRTIRPATEEEQQRWRELGWV